MEDYQVKHYMTADVIVIKPDLEIRRAVHLLLNRDISGVPVVDDDGAVQGMLTERDCIEIALQASYHDEPGGTVGKYMTAPVISVTPETSLMDVAEMMVESPHRRFPVLEEGRLVGLISRRDVLRALDKGPWFSRST